MLVDVRWWKEGGRRRRRKEGGAETALNASTACTKAKTNSKWLQRYVLPSAALFQLKDCLTTSTRKA